MGKKIKVGDKAKPGFHSPGPGTYTESQNSPKANRSVSIPRERRHVGSSTEKLYGAKKANLGPGQYELESIFEKKRLKGFKFTKDIDKRQKNYIEPHLR